MEQSGLIPFPSIRIQLLILALIVLVVPWIGVQSIREMEALLRQQQAHALQNIGSTVIDAIELQPQALLQHHESLFTTPENSEIYVNESSQHIMMDGFSDDWPENIIWQSFDSEYNLLAGRKDSKLAFDLATIEAQGTVYFLLRVKDDVLYQTPNPIHSPRSGDHLLLSLSAHDDDLRHYVLSSSSPGWLRVIPVSSPASNETRIQADLQRTPEGYTVEIAIPSYLAGTSMSLSVVDQDADDPANQSQVGNASAETTGNTGMMFRKNEKLQTIIDQYSTRDQRISVLDARSNILAQSGNAFFLAGESPDQSSQLESILYGIYRLIVLADAPADNEQRLGSKMQGQYIQHALQGLESSHYSVTDQGVGVVSIALPLILDGHVMGVTVVEGSTQGISNLKSRAIYRMIVTTLVAVVIVALVLVLYASLLAGRITRLKQQMQNAVSEDGRIENSIHRSVLSDEIGDLNRGFADMVDRLQEYNRYLETMASKLSHELRTPLTVVQSSLENLQQQLPENHETLLERANEGLTRLRVILSNLTEASRLENALKSTQIEPFNLVNVVEGCVAGYQQAYPEINFIFLADSKDIQVHGSPELIAQLLDKLIANAIDFQTPGTSIDVAVHKKFKYSELSVQNQGPALPSTMQGAVFESMVSNRDKKNHVPHLGLGLYIVRLIAEFHHGKAFAENTDTGVRFGIHFRP
jgi:dedicated sortase system histidine kinase